MFLKVIFYNDKLFDFCLVKKLIKQEFYFELFEFSNFLRDFSEIFWNLKLKKMGLILGAYVIELMWLHTGLGKANITYGLHVHFKFMHSYCPF